MLSASLHFQVFFKLSLPYTSRDEGRSIYTSRAHTQTGSLPLPTSSAAHGVSVGVRECQRHPPRSPVGSCLLASVRAAVSLLTPRPSSTQHCTLQTHTHRFTQSSDYTAHKHRLTHTVYFRQTYTHK